MKVNLDSAIFLLVRGVLILAYQDISKTQQERIAQFGSAWITTEERDLRGKEER